MMNFTITTIKYSWLLLDGDYKISTKFTNVFDRIVEFKVRAFNFRTNYASYIWYTSCNLKAAILTGDTGIPLRWKGGNGLGKQGRKKGERDRYFGFLNICLRALTLKIKALFLLILSSCVK